MFPRLLRRIGERSRRLSAAMIGLGTLGALLLATAAPSLAQTGTIDVSVDPATRAAPVNGTFTVQIVADCTDIGSDGLGAYEFELVYDPDYLEVVSIADAGELAINGRTTVELGTQEVEPGRTAFGAYSYYDGSPQEPGPTGTVALATVELKAKRAGVATLDLENVRLADTQGTAWPDDGRNVNTVSGMSVSRVPAHSSDFDGNQTTDLAVWRPRNGKWFVQGQFEQGFGLAGDIPVPGDYDGDGDSDLAVWRPANGKWYVEGQFSQSWGLSADIPVPGDYDGDGDTDLAVWRPSDRKWYVQGQFEQGFGLAGDIPVPADYDGDGDTDLAVWRPANGKWYVHGQFSQSFGLPGDVPVPGDYDGDGVIDLAVWRPIIGKWLVLGQFNQSWGLPGDIPVPGNYDGDADTDLAVWRPANGKWFVYGQFSQNYGLAHDMPVAR
jgi:hypothetical protein